MTAKAKTTVTVINRNGSIEVHRPGCGDLQRAAANATIWNVKARSLRDVQDDASTDDVTVMPCCPSLDGRATKRNAEWARQYRLRSGTNRYPVLITMD